MTPEQAASLLNVATLGTVAALVIWLRVYIPKVAEQKLKEKEQDLANEQRLNETEINAKIVETEIKRRQDLALVETLEQILVMFTQQHERHTKGDERNAENTEKAIEANNRLASSFETLNASTLRSQTWQEKRTEDYLASIDIVSERTANIERASADTREKVDTVVTTLAAGLEHIKLKLDSILLEAKKNPNKDALERLEKEIAQLIILAKPISDAASRNEVTRPLPEIEDTKDLHLPTETTDEKKEDAA